MPLLGSFFVGATLWMRRRAKALDALLSAQELRFTEDAVPLRIRSLALLSAQWNWARANVRVTPRAVYLLQFNRFGPR